MENEILKAIVNNGAWAVIFVWLLLIQERKVKLVKKNYSK